MCRGEAEERKITRKRAGKDEKGKRATEEALAFSIFPSSTARLLFLTIFISFLMAYSAEASAKERGTLVI